MANSRPALTLTMLSAALVLALGACIDVVDGDRTATTGSRAAAKLAQRAE